MKHVFIRLISAMIAVVLVMVSMVSVAFAQDAGATPAATPPAVAPAPAPAIELSPEVGLFMEVHFVQLKGKFFEKAYASTSEAFRKDMKLAEFIQMVSAARLTDFTTRKWLSEAADPKTGLVTIRGEFTGSDNLVHTVVFELIKKGDTYEITGMTETLSVQLIASLFPKDAALQALLVKDLSDIAKTVNKSTFRKFYKGMAKNARKNIKFITFNKAMRAFKKEKKDITLSADSKIVVAETFPTIDKDGNIVVKGEYQNGKYTVSFVLGYSYEWDWKINSLNVNPVAIAAPAAKVEEKK